MGELQPGEEAEMRVGVVFLAEGTFGFRAAVEQFRLKGSEGTEGEVVRVPDVRFSEALRVDVGGL